MALDTAKQTARLRGLTAKFDNAVKAAAPFYPQLCTEVDSKGSDEQYGLLGAVPGVREWIGERDAKELRAADWTLKNRPWEVTVTIDRDDLDDDRLGMYRTTLAQVGKRAALHPDKLLMILINAAQTGLCFDGQAFFSAAHSWGDSGAQANLLTPAMAGAAPTVAEFKVAFNAMVAALHGFVDDQGEQLNSELFEEDNKNLVLMVPSALRQTAYDALTTALTSTGGTNLVLDRPRIVTATSYSSSVSCDLYRNNEPIRPFLFQRRKPLSRGMKNRNDLEFKHVLFMTEARYNAGYGAWWTGVRATFT